MSLPTGPTIILDDLPPRSWSDVTVPEIPAGVDHEPFYSGWLTDYLIKNPAPLSKQQKEYVDSLPSDFISCMSEYYPEGLAQRFADCEFAIEIVSASNAAGESWEEFSARQKKAWQSQNEDGWDFENEWHCSRWTWERVGAENQLMMIAGPNPNYPDIPLRAYISLEINGLDREGALEVVRGYLGDRLP
jgi:hypothetical protein